MRAIRWSIIGLALIATLWSPAASTAQTTSPAAQLLTADDLSSILEGLWSGGCSSFSDLTNCTLQETDGTGFVSLVVQTPIPGGNTAAPTLEDWREPFDTAAASGSASIEEVPQVADAALALIRPDGTIDSLQFYQRGTTGALIARIGRPTTVADLTTLARTALPRIGVSSQPGVTPRPPGSSAATVPVPAFVGGTLGDAQILAIRVGIQLEVRYDETSEQPVGTVLVQDPLPGTAVGFGDVVSVIVSGALATAAPAQTAAPVGSVAPAPTSPPATPAPVATAAPIATAPPPAPPGAAGPVQAPGPADISLDPVVIATSALAAAGIVLLIPFPSALFNSTLEENYDEIRGWFRFRRRRARPDDDAKADDEGGPEPGGTATTTAEAEAEASADEATAEGGTAEASPEAGAATPAGASRVVDRFWATRVGIASFFLIAGILYGFLDPTFGLTGDSLLLLVGILAALAVVIAGGDGRVPMGTGASQRRAGVVPGAAGHALVVALACVLVTRITDFQPGLPVRRACRSPVRGGRARNAPSVASTPSRARWSPVSVPSRSWSSASSGRSRAAAGATGAWRPIDVALSALVIGGFEGLLFGMLPLTGTAGREGQGVGHPGLGAAAVPGHGRCSCTSSSTRAPVTSSTPPRCRWSRRWPCCSSSVPSRSASGRWFRYRPMDRLRERSAAVAAAAAPGTTEVSATETPPAAIPRRYPRRHPRRHPRRRPTSRTSRREMRARKAARRPFGVARVPRMRAMAGVVVALMLACLLGIGGVVAAQTTPPSAQLLTAEDVSGVAVGQWTGTCSYLGVTGSPTIDCTLSRIDPGDGLRTVTLQMDPIPAGMSVAAARAAWRVRVDPQVAPASRRSAHFRAWVTRHT